MALVDDYGPDAGQIRIALHSLHQQPGGHDLDPRLRSPDALVAHRVPDAPARLLTQQLSQPPGRGPGGDPPRFGHHDPSLEGVGQRQR